MRRRSFLARLALMTNHLHLDSPNRLHDPVHTRDKSFCLVFVPNAFLAVLTPQYSDSYQRQEWHQILQFSRDGSDRASPFVLVYTNPYSPLFVMEGPPCHREHVPA